MSVDGTWKLEITSQLGQQVAIVEFAGAADGSITGNARHPQTGELAPLTEISLTGNSLRWHQKIRNPMRLNLIFTTVIDGDQLTGSVKARMMPGKGTVTGRRESADVSA
ncbi:hypothetical protein [Nocardia spumae]|uniref:hypothetical protein n=1 Tax=Nocardia spumae TaxID=2887190 RepID=UPI001D141D91|nr:hypothetical protein [Nocardia spumae]